jgi:hypothetical protein
MKFILHINPAVPGFAKGSGSPVAQLKCGRMALP